MEEIELYLDEAKEMMDKSIEHTRSEFAKIRAGKATPAMLDSVKVPYYGAPTPLTQVATINTSDARTLVIKPFDKNVIGDIGKAIRDSDLGLNPQNDGEVIRINIPPLTEERRRELAKQAKAEAENGKISIRNIRKDTNESLRKLLKDADGVSEDDVKRAEDKVQALTDKHTTRVDELLVKKEAEIMTV